MKKFFGLRARFYSYLIDNSSEDKKVKRRKMCVVKRKLKFKHYKIYLKATQLENKINQLEESKVNTGSLRENHNEFMKNNRLLLKTQQRFKSERHNVFTEEINKIS